MTTIKPTTQHATAFAEMIKDRGFFNLGLVQTHTDAYEIDFDDDEEEQMLITDIWESAEECNIPTSEIEIITK